MLVLQDLNLLQRCTGTLAGHAQRLEDGLLGAPSARKRALRARSGAAVLVFAAVKLRSTKVSLSMLMAAISSTSTPTVFLVATLAARDSTCSATPWVS